MSPPNMAAAFRPRADAALLSRLVQDAWQAKNTALMAQQEAFGIREAAARKLDALFPIADMLILQRYGQAEEVSKVNVSIKNAETDYYENVGVELPRKILVPLRGASLLATAKWSEGHNEYGYRSDYWETMPEDEKREAIERQAKHEKAALGEETLPFFVAVIESRNAFKREYRQATAWPTEFKTAHGHFPTWAEIAAEFPVLGAFMKEQ